MKTKYLSLFAVLFVALITASCHKEPSPTDLIDDKDKIDIKGSLSNGDMRHPNIEAGYWRRQHQQQTRPCHLLRHRNFGIQHWNAILYGRPTLRPLPPRHQQRHG